MSGKSGFLGALLGFGSSGQGASATPGTFSGTKQLLPTGADFAGMFQSLSIPAATQTAAPTIDSETYQGPSQTEVAALEELLESLVGSDLEWVGSEQVQGFRILQFKPVESIPKTTPEIDSEGGESSTSNGEVPAQVFLVIEPPAPMVHQPTFLPGLTFSLTEANSEGQTGFLETPARTTPGEPPQIGLARFPSEVLAVLEELVGTNRGEKALVIPISAQAAIPENAGSLSEDYRFRLFENLPSPFGDDPTEAEPSKNLVRLEAAAQIPSVSQRFGPEAGSEKTSDRFPSLLHPLSPFASTPATGSLADGAGLEDRGANDTALDALKALLSSGVHKPKALGDQTSDARNGQPDRLGQSGKTTPESASFSFLLLPKTDLAQQLRDLSVRFLAFRPTAPEAAAQPATVLQAKPFDPSQPIAKVTSSLGWFAAGNGQSAQPGPSVNSTPLALPVLNAAEAKIPEPLSAPARNPEPASLAPAPQAVVGKGAPLELNPPLPEVALKPSEKAATSNPTLQAETVSTAETNEEPRETPRLVQTTLGKAAAAAVAGSLTREALDRLTEKWKQVDRRIVPLTTGTQAGVESVRAGGDITTATAATLVASGVEGKTLPKAQESALLDQVIKILESPTASRGGEIRIRLHPESLGEVHLKMTFRAGVLTAELRASSAGTQEVLARQTGQIQAVLAQSGLSAEHVVVRTGHLGSGESPAFGSHSERENTAARNRDQAFSEGGSQGGKQQPSEHGQGRGQRWPRNPLWDRWERFF